MGGMTGEDPVAMTQVFAVYGIPSRLTLCSSTKTGLPNSTRAPRPQKRSAESCFWIVPMTERIRPTTFAKSMGFTSISGRP